MSLLIHFGYVLLGVSLIQIVPEANGFSYENLPAVAMDYKVHIDAGKEDCYFQYVNPGATFYVSFQVLPQPGDPASYDIIIRSLRRKIGARSMIQNMTRSIDHMVARNHVSASQEKCTRSAWHVATRNMWSLRQFAHVARSYFIRLSYPGKRTRDTCSLVSWNERTS